MIGAVIDLGLCLNLLESQHLLVVREAYQNLLEACKNSGVPLPKNRAPRGSRETLLRDLDCATINMVHQIREVSNATPYDTVRAAFIEGQPLYESSGFREFNHIQICVRNLRCIKGYFFPLDDASTR